MCKSVYFSFVTLRFFSCFCTCVFVLLLTSRWIALVDMLCFRPLHCSVESLSHCCLILLPSMWILICSKENWRVKWSIKEFSLYVEIKSKYTRFFSLHWLLFAKTAMFITPPVSQNNKNIMTQNKAKN